MSPFEQSFKPDPWSAPPQPADGASQLEPYATGFTDFIAKHGGKSFENGMYRVYSFEAQQQWTGIAAQLFPLKGTYYWCFASDWAGNLFALHLGKRLENGQTPLAMLEIGFDDTQEIDLPFAEFHDSMLPSRKDRALSGEYYQEWLGSGGSAPDLGQCVGYRKPLQLGGQDEVGNLELTDMSVYWGVTSQIILKVRELPEGTPISAINLVD